MKKFIIILAAAMMTVSCSEQFNAAYLLSSGAKIAQAATLSDEQIQAYVGQYIKQLDAQNTVLPGDVDVSGDVNVADAVLLARFLAEDGGVTVSAQGKLNANVSGDADITSDDLTGILEFLAGIRTGF